MSYDTISGEGFGVGRRCKNCRLLLESFDLHVCANECSCSWMAALWNGISREMHCSCSLYIYESFSLVLALWEFFTPSTLYSASSVRNKILFFAFWWSKVLRTTLKWFISSRYGTRYYLALMLFFQRYRLYSRYNCVCLTRHFLLQKGEIVSPRGNLIISPKGCSVIYFAVRTVVLSGAATKHGSLCPFSSNSFQHCKGFLGNTDSCGQGGLSCIKW